LSGPYTTFFTLGQGVLKMLGSIYDVSVQQADIEELRMRMLTMPAHSDVPAGDYGDMTVFSILCNGPLGFSPEPRRAHIRPSLPHHFIQHGGNRG